MDWPRLSIQAHVARSSDDAGDMPARGPICIGFDWNRQTTDRLDRLKYGEMLIMPAPRKNSVASRHLFGCMAFHGKQAVRQNKNNPK